MFAVARKMPPSSSALQSIHLFRLCDMLLKIKLSVKNIQRNHPQFTIRKISPNPCSLYSCVGGAKARTPQGRQEILEFNGSD